METLTFNPSRRDTWENNLEKIASGEMKVNEIGIGDLIFINSGIGKGREALMENIGGFGELKVFKVRLLQKVGRVSQRYLWEHEFEKIINPSRRKE